MDIYKYKQLYHRIKISHITIILVLCINVLFFTENLISQIIQLILVIAIFIHDFDELKLKNLHQELEDKIDKEIKKNIQTQKSLLHKSKLETMGNMLSMISHQWRQPLTAIKANIQSIEYKNRTNRLTSDFIIATSQNASAIIDQLSNTLNEFRSFYKPDGDIKLYNIDELIQKTLKVIIPSLTNHTIKVSYNPNTMPNGYVYQSEFIQVLLNIISNAKEALIENKIQDPKIDIQLKEDKRRVYIDIIDNANGIDDEILEKIYEPYFSTKSKNGKGLGLYMSKVLIEEYMYGIINVENIQNGVKFTIILQKELD